MFGACSSLPYNFVGEGEGGVLTQNMSLSGWCIHTSSIKEGWYTAGFIETMIGTEPELSKKAGCIPR